MKVNAQYAQDHFDEFLSALKAGEPVELTHKGGETLQLQRVPSASADEPTLQDQGLARQFGMARGLIHLAPDWDSPETNAEIAADFEKSEIFPTIPAHSLASESFARELVNALQAIPSLSKDNARSRCSSRERINPALVTTEQIEKELRSCKPWTVGVQSALRSFAHNRGWTLQPEDDPYKNEYLCDFMLFETNYGCRIACESQWYHSSNHAAELNWAFDKLRGVKADIKLFIYEGSRASTEKMMSAYLESYGQLSPDEAYLALHWNSPSFEAYFYQPAKSGRPTVAQFYPLP